jgi:hypothetical protein
MSFPVCNSVDCLFENMLVAVSHKKSYVELYYCTLQQHDKSASTALIPTELIQSTSWMQQTQIYISQSLSGMTKIYRTNGNYLLLFPFTKHQTTVTYAQFILSASCKIQFDIFLAWLCCSQT